MLKFAGWVMPFAPAPSVVPDPWEETCIATGRVATGCVVDAAIQLLPHLIEAVHRACRVGVIGKGAAVSQLKRSAGRAFTLLDTLVRGSSGEALTGAAGDQVGVVVGGEAVLRLLREGEVVVCYIRVCWAADERSGKHSVVERGFGLGSGGSRPELDRSVPSAHTCSVRTGVPSRFTMPLEKQIPYGLAPFGNIGCEDVIEATVLADDDDYVLDGRAGIFIA